MFSKYRKPDAKPEASAPEPKPGAQGACVGDSGRRQAKRPRRNARPQELGGRSEEHQIGARRRERRPSAASVSMNSRRTCTTVFWTT
jgi:hypothetical protein